MIIDALQSIITLLRRYLQNKQKFQEQTYVEHICKYV